jgi:hypothetical protein
VRQDQVHTHMIDDTSVYTKQYHNEKESVKVFYYMTESLNLKQINERL